MGQLCDLICASFLISKVLDMEDTEIPCISLENRARIVQYRNEDEFGSNKGLALYSEMQSACFIPVMVSPCAKTSYRSIFYGDHQYKRMKYFLSNGAEKDYSTQQKVWEILLDFREARDHDDVYVGCSNCSVRSKRILALETFNKLNDIGLVLVKIIARSVMNLKGKHNTCK